MSLPISARRTAVTAIAAAAITLAACGGDGSDARPSVDTLPVIPTSTSVDPAATTTAVPSDSTVPGSAAETTVADTAAPTTEAAVTLPDSVPVGSNAPATTAVLDSTIIALEAVGDFEAPVDLAWRTADATLFVVEQDGLILPVRDGTAGDAVLDITSLTSANGEQGLLGLAFSPDGTHAYINYTNLRGDTVITEYAVDTSGTFDVSSRREVITIDQPYDNHNGGNVMFGPDGMLYIGMGDGGAGGDPERRALNVGELLGKILRIDPRASDGAAYTVPDDNPFVGVAGARPEIWAVGVRNPWRMSFDRQTGDLWFGDVGQNAWEEVDVAWADEGAGRGLNFGWSAFEGTHEYNDDQPTDGVTPPIYEYRHGNEGCSISGGAVYRGSAIPSLVGWYVYSDYCGSRVMALSAVDKAFQQVVPIAPSSTVSAVREGPDGELYVLSLNGLVSKIVPA